jgi:hypothetical protein
MHANALIVQSRSEYEDTIRQRDEFAAEFPDQYVSPVERNAHGVWTWIFCPECPP